MIRIRIRIQYMKGYTAIEMLIAIAIISLIAGLALTGLKTYKTSSELAGAVEDGISYLEDARAQTLSSKQISQYGVHFEQNRIVFFKGISFIPTDPNNREQALPSSVEISAISLNGGGSDVVFQRLTGVTNQYGTVILRLKNDIEKKRIITIEKSGAVHL